MPRNPLIGGAMGGSFGQLRVEFDMKQVQGLLLEGQNVKMFDNYMRDTSMTIAERIAKLAREKLKVGGEKDIGASGQAAENIHVKKVGKTSAEIFEGPYPANYYIREGRTAGAPRPPVKAIIDWIAEKGISITPPKDQKGTLRWTKKGGARANLTSKPTRPFKRDLKGIAGRIAIKIGEEGMTHFKGMYPPGNRYDYYGEIISRTPGMKYFDMMITRGYGQWFPLYLQFLGDGRPRRIPRRPVGGIE